MRLANNDLAKRYWAAKPIDQIAPAIVMKFEEFQKWGDSTGYFERAKLCYNRYYGIDQPGTGTLQSTDNHDNTERTSMNVPHYKSLLKRIHILTAQNKLQYAPRARNSDAASQIDSDLARGILEYYGDEKDMHSVMSEGVETALITLEAHIHCPWNYEKGDEITADESGEVVFEGDQEFEIYSVFDIARSTTLAKSPWKIIRQKVNKYEYAAMHPEFYDDIIAMNIEYVKDRFYLDPTLRTLETYDDDSCYKYILYHERNKALPDGREVHIIGEHVLSDGPLDYECIPVFQLKPDKMIQTTLCDSPGVDILALQEAINLMTSGVLTNNLNNCQQLIWSSDPNTTVRAIDDNIKMVTSSIKPEGLNLTRSADENYKFLDLMISWQQLLSGINSTTRGQPEASLKSGNSLALMLAQAIQYVNELQKNYAQCASQVASCVISNLKTKARSERVAYIVGESRKSFAKVFKSDDLKGIERISCDVGNPLLSNLAGRWELTQMMMQYQVVTDPKHIVSFIRTGEMDQTTENQFKDAILIRQENEDMMKGIVPPVVDTDIHPAHIMQHREILNDREARRDPNVTKAVTDHILAHLEAMKMMSPDLQAILGLQPLPSQQMPPADPNAPAMDPSQIPPDDPNDPELMGQNLPSVPPGSPPEVEANYQAAISGMPETQDPSMMQ